MKVEQLFLNRKKMLRRLAYRHGTIAEFCRKYDLDEVSIRQRLTSRGTFGEKAARAIEETCGLPAFILDFDLAVDWAVDFLNTYLSLPQPDQQELLRVCDLLVQRREALE